MTKISRSPLKPYIKREILKEFWYSFDILKLKELHYFFQYVFTPTEIMMIAKRLAILRALRKGIGYESIQKTFQVTGSTVTKLNNLLLIADDEFLEVLDKLVHEAERRWEEFLKRRKEAGGITGGGLVFPKKITS